MKRSSQQHMVPENPLSQVKVKKMDTRVNTIDMKIENYIPLARAFYFLSCYWQGQPAGSKQNIYLVSSLQLSTLSVSKQARGLHFQRKEDGSLKEWPTAASMWKYQLLVRKSVLLARFPSYLEVAQRHIIHRDPLCLRNDLVSHQ